MQKLSRMILAVALLAIAVTAVAQDSERERRFLFELGIGPGFVAVAERYRDGDMRLPLHTHVVLGYAIRPELYGILIADSTAQVAVDLIEGSMTSVRIYGAGARFIPEAGGWVYGGHLGVALVEAGTESSLAGTPLGGSDTEESDTGFGIGGVVGYDFAKRRTGFSFLAGLGANVGIAGGDAFASGSIFGSVMWK